MRIRSFHLNWNEYVLEIDTTALQYPEFEVDKNTYYHDFTCPVAEQEQALHS